MSVDKNVTDSSDYLSIILNNISDQIVNGSIIRVRCFKDQSTNQVLVEAEKCLRELNCNKIPSLELVEILFSDGQPCKERCIYEDENPYVIRKLWPQPTNMSSSFKYEFVLRPKMQNYHNFSSSLNPKTMTDKYLSGLMTSKKMKDHQDLCNLPELNENTLLDNLKRRFLKNKIYTYIGSILISINPFHYLPIYNPKDIEMYQNKKLIDLPPHVFAIADAAYYSMMTTKTNQCIVISGESGSGKTENSNFLLHHLSALSQRNFYSNGIEKNITGVGPVLEAFGNAKTVHNNNSSRFGKFVQVAYREDGTVSGATVEKYLLEKSRIVSQAPNERNYHVFYYLLAGASVEEKALLHLTKPEDFFYLNQNDYPWLSMNVDLEVHEFDRLKNAMSAVGFSNDIQQRLFTVLSAILHIGNIEFKKRVEVGNHHDENASVSNVKQVQVVSNLLKVTEKTLLEALTRRRTMAGGETVVIGNKIDEAISTRNATAKCLYNALFNWIVFQINAVLLSKHDLNKHSSKYIGVLDIFGFEDFQFNSFEQFCINYANENLHFYFNQHIFKLEQEEYIREGIYWENIEFIDNTGCLDLFSKKPSGLLHLLDEESNLPCGSNEILLSKFHTSHHSNSYYEVPQKKQSAFSIVHYAGKVKYQIQDFREKNTDLMRNDVMMLLKSSRVEFIRELVGHNPIAIMRWSMLRIFFRAYFAFMSISKKCKSQGSILHRYSRVVNQKKNQLFTDLWKKNKMYKPRIKLAKHMQEVKAYQNSKLPLSSRGSKSKNKSPSISAQFHNSLMMLTETLNQATPFFIRCIKSNQEKAPKMFDDELVERQLRYTGMLATVRIRQSGYNYRLTFEDFVCSFHVLLPKGRQSGKEDIQQFLNQLNINKNNFQIGMSKVFLREAEKIYLEELLHEALLKKIVMIQRWCRVIRSRRVFRNIKMSIICIQSHIRGYLARCRFSQLRLEWSASVLIQSTYKMHQTRMAYSHILMVHGSLMRICKAYLAQQRLLTGVVVDVGGGGVKVDVSGGGGGIKVDVGDGVRVDVSGGGGGVKVDVGGGGGGGVKVDVGGGGGDGRHLNSNHQSTCEFETRKPPIKWWMVPITKDADKKQPDDSLTSSPRYVDNFADIIRKPDRDFKHLDKDDDSTTGNDKGNDEDDYDDDDDDDNNNDDDKEASRKLYIGTTSPSRESYNISCNTGKHANEARMMKKKMKDHNHNNTMVGMVRRDDVDGLVKQGGRSQTQLDIPNNEDLYENEVDSRLSSLDSSNVYNAHASFNNPLESYRERLGVLAYDEEVEGGGGGSGGGGGGGGSGQVLINDTSTPLKPLHPQPPPSLLPSQHTPRMSSYILDETSDDTSTDGNNITKDKKSHSLSSQAGPEDLEVLVEPVVERVNADDDDDDDRQDVFRIDNAFEQKHIKAPLADEENFNDDLIAVNEENNLDYEVKVVSMDEDEEEGRNNTNNYDDDDDDAQRRDDSSFLNFTKSILSAQDSNSSFSKKLTNECTKSEKLKPKYTRNRKLSIVKQRQQGHKTPTTTTTTTSWNVSGTTQWRYPLDLVIENLKELRQFEHHLSLKVVYTDKLKKERGQKEKENIIDEIFKCTLHEFHNNLLTQISTAKESTASEYAFSYERLMKLVEEILRVKSRNKFEDDNDFPHTFFINAFRGFLDEFIKKKESKELPDIKVKKAFKKAKKEAVFEHLGHKFLLIQFGIATFCESCHQKLWVLEKGYTCKVCKLTIHRKCYSKLNAKCSGSSDAASLVARKGHTVIGSPLDYLMQSAPEGHKVHPVIERLMTTIEMEGLYTEGLYRKVGLESASRKLIVEINSAPDTVDFQHQPIHVLTSVLKTFFREMPEPVMTFEFYQDFIRFTDIEDMNDRMVAMYSLVDKLPQFNHALLERLIFHLAKVALQEESNRMSAGGLAIIFSPSILRTSQQLPMQESLLHVPRQSMCVECLITSQMQKTQSTLRFIENINKDTIDVTNKINTLKANRKRVSVEDLKVEEDDLMSSQSSDELVNLTHKMKTLQRKKQELTAALSSMPCRKTLIEDGRLSSEEVDSVAGDDDDTCSFTTATCDNTSQYSDSDSMGYVP